MWRNGADVKINRLSHYAGTRAKYSSEFGMITPRTNIAERPIAKIFDDCGRSVKGFDNGYHVR